MINILYIAMPSSVHDIKWMSYYSGQKEKYKVYIVGEKQNDKATAAQNLADKNITILPSIDSFSITSPMRTLRAISQLRSYIRGYRIDVVHILFATPHALWANYISVPYIITTRGSDALVVLPALLRSGGLRGMYDKLLFRLFRNTFKNARSVTSTSVAQAEKLKELFGIQNMEVIRTGVDVEKIAASKDAAHLNARLTGRDFIFSPRFMSPLYNPEVQIDALAYLPKEVIERYTFVFIRGRDYDAAYYESMSQKLERLASDSGVSYLIEDYLEQEQLWVYYNYASLTMMTPRSDGTPNSALEAMAAQCPLIMPALPYDKFIFENASLVLSENDPKEMARLITKALTDYPAGMLQLAYQRVYERGNRSIEMNKLEKLYS